MKRRAPISQVLTTEVTYVERHQPLSEVYHLLIKAPFHHVPVVEGGRPVGIVSSIDVLRLAYDVEGTDERALGAMLDYQFNIDDAMSTELRTLTTSATVRDAADAMADGEVHSVLVVDDGGKLAGIVTTTDLIRYLRDL